MVFWQTVHICTVHIQYIYDSTYMYIYNVCVCLLRNNCGLGLIAPEIKFPKVGSFTSHVLSRSFTTRAWGHRLIMMILIDNMIIMIIIMMMMIKNNDKNVAPVPTLEWGLPAQTPTQQPKECLIDMTQHWQKKFGTTSFDLFCLLLPFYLFLFKNILNQYIYVYSIFPTLLLAALNSPWNFFTSPNLGFAV